MRKACINDLHEFRHVQAVVGTHAKRVPLLNMLFERANIAELINQMNQNNNG